VELTVKLLEDTNEVLVEHSSTNIVKVFQSVSEAVEYIRRVLEDEIRRRGELQQRQDEVSEEHHGRAWYIRFPLSRLFSALRFVYERGINDVRRALEEYCRVTGLSKSNIRALLPTFAALKLQENGKLTEQGRLVAKYLHEGKLDQASDILFDCALSNPVLREVLQEVWSTDPNTISEAVKTVLSRHGYTRHDELNYTTELVKFLIRYSHRCRCYIICNIVSRYLREKRKVHITCIPDECLPDVIRIVLEYLIESRPYIMQSVLDPAGVRIDQIHVVREHDKLLIVDKHVEHVVQVVPKVLVTREILYASMLRQELEKLRSEIMQQRYRNNRVSFLLAVLVLVNDLSTRFKLYLEHLVKDQSFSTKIIDLP